MRLGAPPIYALCTWLTVLCLCVYTAYAETWDTLIPNIETKQTPIDFLRYGMLENGTMFVHLEVVSTKSIPMFLLVCSEDEYFRVHEDLGICYYLYKGEDPPCKITQLFYLSLQLYYNFPTFGDYYFSLARCSTDNHDIDDKLLNVKIYLELENPGENRLSSALIPAPTMYLLLAIMWAIVLLVWLFVAAPKWKHMSPLQYTMLTYPVMKIISSAVSAQYFHSLKIYDDISVFSWIMYNALLIIVLLDFHYVLLLLSKAWSISGFLDKSDYHLMFSMLVGLCCSLMFKYFYDNSDLAFLLASLAYIGLRVMILACVFININHTIGRLESEMLNYNAEVANVNIRPIVVKLHKIFVLIKFALMLWVILNVAEFFCNILFFGGAEENWIDKMNTEFIDFLLSLCIGILLLPDVSLQIDIPRRTRSSQVLQVRQRGGEENNQHTDEDHQNTDPSEPGPPTAGQAVLTNENGELELTTFSATSSSPILSSTPLLTPELANGIPQTNTYQKIEYPVEDEEEFGSDDEVQLVDRRRAHVQ